MTRRYSSYESDGTDTNETTSSTGVATPRSSSLNSVQSASINESVLQSHGATGNGQVAGPSTERIIVSIEVGIENSISISNESTATTRTPRSTTPSVSLTPPPSLTNTAQTSQTSSSSDTAGGVQLTAGIDDRLAQLRLGSPESALGMSDMAAAIERVAAGSDARTVLLEPESAERATPQRESAARRRRSSSRLSMTLHEVRDEEPPRDRFHEPSFQQAIREAKDLVTSLAEVLGSSALHIDPDSTVRRLHGEAQTLAEFRCSSTRTVGFVGDSGVGKSSTINSLLDTRGLARTSNNGAACTCVVTEYHYHDSNDYAIEVEQFTMDEIAEQLSRLVRAYRHFYLNGDEIDNAEDKKASEERAKVARDTFRAMFRGQLNSEEFLTRESEDSVLSTLRSWAQNVDLSHTGGRQVRSTLAECSDLLMSLTSEDSSTLNPAVWPYIRKIKVFLKSHILSKGLVLVDLPGLRDLNSARQNITERYILRCDEIFVISNIGRATTDAGVMAVFELARQAKLSNVGIICTKSDDIRGEEARRDWQGQKSRTIKGLMDNAERHKRNCDTLEMELADLDEYNNLAEEDVDEQRQLHWELRRAKKHLSGCEFKLKEFLITTRNGDIQRKLHDIYHAMIPGNQLRVFCISNLDYWDKRALTKDVALPFLHLSGIIALRKHCISIVAQSQLRAAEKYIRDDIPALLGDVDLWVQLGAGSADSERKQLIIQTVNMLESRLGTELTGRTSQMNTISRAINQQFDELLHARSDISAWARSARVAGSQWSRWHHSTYSAFCRNYGDYCTDKVGRHNWNGEAMAKMVEDLMAQWQVFISGTDSRLSSVVQAIESVMDWAVEHLELELSESSDLQATLCQALDNRQNLLVAAIEDIWQIFGDESSNLRIDAFSPIGTSLFGRAMNTAYEACNLEYGRGSDQRRKGIIRSKLDEPALFADLMREFRKRSRELTLELQNNIRAVVTEHLGNLHETFDIVRNENITTESEQDPDFRRRVETMVDRLKTGIRRVQETALS